MNRPSSKRAANALPQAAAEKSRPSAIAISASGSSNATGPAQLDGAPKLVTASRVPRWSNNLATPATAKTALSPRRKATRVINIAGFQECRSRNISASSYELRRTNSKGPDHLALDQAFRLFSWRWKNITRVRDGTGN